MWWDRQLLANVNSRSMPTSDITFRHPDVGLLVAYCQDLHMPESPLAVLKEFSITTSELFNHLILARKLGFYKAYESKKHVWASIRTMCFLVQSFASFAS